jgi:hypothetical protein
MAKRLSGNNWKRELERLWLSEHVGYSVEYRIRDSDAEFVVIRLSDGQVVDRCPWHRVLRGASDVEEQWSAAMAFLKKAAEKDAKSAGTISKDGEQFAKKYPALLEYLTTDKWPEGGERVVSTLMMFCEDGTFKACLNDRDAGKSLWVSGASVPDALEALESILRHGGGEWRVNSQFKAKKAQKRS